MKKTKTPLKVLSTRIDIELWNKLDTYCKKKGMKVQFVVAQAIRGLMNGK